MGKFRRTSSIVAAASCVVAGLVIAAEPAQAVTFLTVTTTTDSSASSTECTTATTTVPSPLTLRNALCLADNIGGSVTVQVPSGTFTTPNGELVAGTNPGTQLTVQGAGAGSTIIDGGGAHRVLDIDPSTLGGVVVTISAVTITNGSDNSFGGGGIIAGSGNSASGDSLTINDSVVSNNHANSGAPAVTNNPGGGLQFVGGALTVINTTFSSNGAASSPGAAIAYQAQGVAAGESFTLTSSTISGNSATNSSGPGVVNGGAVDIGGPAGTPSTISGVTFSGNSGVGSAGPVRGAALRLQNGTLTVSDSTFVGNTISGNGTGAAVEVAGGTATLRRNRIVGNTGGVSVDQSAGSADAQRNWWGCSAGPGNTGCDSVGGTVTTSPRLVLTATAPATLLYTASTTVTGDLTHDSAGASVPGPFPAFDGLGLGFASVLPAGATCLPGSVSFSGGTATGSCTYAPNGHSGAGQVVLQVDNQSTTRVIEVDEPAAVQTDPVDSTVLAGATASFSASASGYPVPTVQWQRKASGGPGFTDIGGATSATLSFTASTADDGAQYRAHFVNSTGDVVTAAATLTVHQAPAFSSAATATFAVGTAGSFDVTTTGLPAVTSIALTGTLPAGLAYVDHHDGTATISGTPQAGSGGLSSVHLVATNGVDPDATQDLAISVDEAPAVTTDPPASAAAPGDPVSFTAAASGYPTPTVQWQVSTNGGGTWADVPAATSATYSFAAALADNGNQYRAVFTNGSGSATSAPATLTIQQAPGFTSAGATTFTVGTAGSFDVTTDAIPDASVSTTTTLPAWLTLTPGANGTATLAGTPPAGAGGTYPIALHAGNGVDPAADQNFTLTVDEAPHISSAASATFVVGSANSFLVTTDHGFPIPGISRTGTLPNGLTFVDNLDGTATISGTPAAGTGGSYPLTITASNGVSPDATQSFTLTVNEASAFTSATSTTFTAGSAGSFTVTTTGIPDAALSEDGALPAGVTFVDNHDGTATLAGTPGSGTGGVYPLTLAAENGVQPSGSQSFTLTVDEAAAITSSSTTTFGSGVAGTFTVTTRGYPAPTLTASGTLPGGVTFVDNGDGTATLAGTPAAGTAGDWPLSITAANGIAGDDTQSFVLTVATAPQTITFTSTPPVSGVVGQTYPVAATGGASGNPVTFAIDAASTAVCSIAAGTVTFDHPGSCKIDAAQAGDAQYAPATATQSVPVTTASTTTTVSVQPTTITAAVGVVAPGAGTPTGSVTFSVDGSVVGTAPLAGGTATLTYSVPAGSARTVAAVYTGDADFAGSAGSTARNDPSITATVSSSTPRTAYGWYRSVVTVTFHCTPDGAPLTAPCPAPVTFTHDGAGQSVTRTITATDGGADSVTVKGINVDRTRPTVRITGVRNGATYAGGAPVAKCVGTDALSGIASCRLTRSTSGVRVTVTATATDRAGNASTARVRYAVLPYFIEGAPYRNGAFVLREGHTYTVVVLTSSRTRPRLYDAAPAGQTPHPADHLLQRAGRQSGLYRYTIAVHIDRGLGRYAYWNLGIKVGRAMQLVRFHPVG